MGIDISAIYSPNNDLARACLDEIQMNNDNEIPYYKRFYMAKKIQKATYHDFAKADMNNRNLVQSDGIELSYDNSWMKEANEMKFYQYHEAKAKLPIKQWGCNIL